MELFSLIINLAAEFSKLARTLVADGIRFIALLARSRTALAAENLFLQKQLAFYQERKIKPRRFNNVTRFMLVLLSHGFAWQDALANVTPKTFIGWHRAGFRLFWRWKSRPGRPPIPIELRLLIREMALSNLSWGRKNALPMNCFSSWGFAYHLVRYASTCPGDRADSHAAINAGPPLFAIMHRPPWPVTSVLS
jgi:hypothetical protein